MKTSYLGDVSPSMQTIGVTTQNKPIKTFYNPSTQKFEIIPQAAIDAQKASRKQGLFARLIAGGATQLPNNQMVEQPAVSQTSQPTSLQTAAQAGEAAYYASIGQPIPQAVTTSNPIIQSAIQNPAASSPSGGSGSGGGAPINYMDTFQPQTTTQSTPTESTPKSNNGMLLIAVGILGLIFLTKKGKK